MHLPTIIKAFEPKTEITYTFDTKFNGGNYEVYLATRPDGHEISFAVINQDAQDVTCNESLNIAMRAAIAPFIPKESRHV